MGKKIAPARRNPHKACPKHVKMCVSHAAKHNKPMIAPAFMMRPYSFEIARSKYHLAFSKSCLRLPLWSARLTYFTTLAK